MTESQLLDLTKTPAEMGTMSPWWEKANDLRKGIC